MKTKLIVLGIVSIILISGIVTTTASNQYTASDFLTSTNKSLNPYDENFEYKYHRDVDDSNDVIASNSDDGFDLTFVDVYAYWSPAPRDEKKNYLSFDYWISNLGNVSNTTGDIEVYYTIYYPDGTEQREYYSTTINKTLDKKGKMWGSGMRKKLSERPSEIKFELICDFPIEDVNPENNFVTTQILPGVTITGTIYGKNLLGDEIPLEDVWIRSDSDVEGYEEWGTPNWGEHGYVLTIPKNPDKGPYEYTLTIDFDPIIVKDKTFKTEPLDQNEYLIKDFEFFGMNFLIKISNFLWDLLFEILQIIHSIT